MPTPFVDYVRHGWSICPIPAGTKSPTADGWNDRERVVTTVERAANLHENAGLCHAYSGTCAIDVDSPAEATAWLAARGVDLDALFNAADAVQIVGRPGRGKLIYKLAVPLPTKQIKADDGRMILELRCGTHRGTTTQDVLPPSIHPGTGQPYTWAEGIAGDWRDLPALPAGLHALWSSLVARAENRATQSPQGATADKMRALLKHQKPDASYDDWVRVGMALHHETAGSDEGLALWDEFSSQGDKYVGIEDLESHWQSFGQHPRPVTLASLRVERVADASDFDVIAVPATLADANAPPRHPLEPVPWDEFMHGPELQWLVDGVLPKAEVAVVFGESGSGKTFFVLDLVAAIARGVPWREHKVQRGRVTYICAEGAAGFRKRVNAYAHQHGLKARDEMPLQVIGAAPDLMNGDVALDVAKRIVAHGGADVIVIDTLSATTPGANENSGEDMGVLLAHCKGLHRATGAVVILVHHSGKDSTKGARGWSGIRAALDAEIEITRQNEMRVANISKLKDEEDKHLYGFRLNTVLVGLRADGKEITSCVVAAAELQGGESAGTKKRALKGLPKLIYDTARDCLPLDGGKGSVAVMRARCIERMPKSEGKDRRAFEFDRALTRSLNGEHIEIEGDSYSVVS